MPLSFDLSGIEVGTTASSCGATTSGGLRLLRPGGESGQSSVSASYGSTYTSTSYAPCQTCDDSFHLTLGTPSSQLPLQPALQPASLPPLPIQPDLASSFTFTIDRVGTGLVRRVAAPVLQRFGVSVASDDCDARGRGDDLEHDQYTIPAGRSMCWSVFFRNDTGRLHPRSLLGNFGHIERLSAWVHLLGGIAFAVYAVVRPTAITQEHTVAETMTTMAAAAVAFCFFSSTVYHVTAPSKTLAYYTRQLDFVGIYTGIAIGGLADYAVATRGFQNTALLSILDGPLAAVLVLAFFLARRGLLPPSDTWTTYLGGCTVTFGLMRRWHVDKDHTATRQATSFLLATSYFMTIPSVFSNFDNANAIVLLLIEVAAVALIVLGMTLDSLWVFPDDALAAGKGPKSLACTSCGCIASSHSIWHVISVVAAVKAAVGRELALSWQR
jgi:predicted membrane channel-forming protein YqfA (hemolysin III family)